jgi:SAM-dependent methyltransferase
MPTSDGHDHAHKHDHNVPTGDELENIPVPELAPYRFVPPSASVFVLIAAVWGALLLPGSAPDLSSALLPGLNLSGLLVSNMRSPGSGLFGLLASKLMADVNPPTIRSAVELLDPADSDTWLEIGAATGTGLAALYEVASPEQVFAVEISPRFSQSLLSPPEGLSAEARARWNPLISTGDARSLPLLSDSVTKVLAVNVVYFLDPLPLYLSELHRVLRPGGRALFACKFRFVEGKPPPFVNTDLGGVLAAVKAHGGFAVTTTEVDLGDPK